MSLQPRQAQISDRQLLPSSTDTLSAQPLPFWRAVLDLPRQYIDALLDPTTVFLEVKRRASWSLILFQLIGFALLTIILVSFVNLITFSVVGTPISMLGSAMASFALRLLILIAILLVYVAIQFLVAKGFRGTGSFREQLYVSLLIAIPMGIVISIMISAAGLNFIFEAYALALSVAAVRAVHNLSRNQAIITMLVSLILVLGVYFTLLAVGVIKLAPSGP